MDYPTSALVCVLVACCSVIVGYGLDVPEIIKDVAKVAFPITMVLFFVFLVLERASWK